MLIGISLLGALFWWGILKGGSNPFDDDDDFSGGTGGT